MDDEAVVERVRAAYGAHHATLWRSLFAFSGSRSIADEAAAEAFAQVLRRGDEVRDVAAWVWRAAFSIARGELQRSRRQPPDTIATDVETADESLSMLLARLAALTETDREILVLCHVGGWRPTELSSILGMSPIALRVRLHRATRHAREILEPHLGGG